MNNSAAGSQNHPIKTPGIFIEIAAQLKQTLPGKEVQELMAPAYRSEGNNPFPGPGTSRAGILILLYREKNTLFTVVIQRNTYPGPHSGQICFPGGKNEKQDPSLEATALREAAEEIGIVPGKVKVLGTLTPLFIPVSQFQVFPYIGYYPETPSFFPDPTEVQNVIPVDLDALLQATPKKMKTEKQKEETLVPGYPANGVFIWGATAMILCEFLEVLRRAGVH